MVLLLPMGGLATMVQQTGAEVAAGAEAGVPSSLQQLFQLEETCDLQATTPFLIQLDLQMQQA